MTFEECINKIERRGYEWLVRSISPTGEHLVGKYFAHIHTNEVSGGENYYSESYKATSDTSVIDALSAAYGLMIGEEE